MRSIYYLAGACAVMAVACMGKGEEPEEPGEPSPEEMGFVTVQWAIEDETSAERCKAYGASAVELVLISTDDNKVTKQVVPCERFDTSVHVMADDYVGTITLVDEDGKSVSEPLPVGPFEVSGEEQTTRRVSFPAAGAAGDRQGERTQGERDGRGRREPRRDTHRH
ncbi:uncharacterized protein SOCEGT47_020360 [Sorangium cellulosum]|uniref:Uncharacterized protein n=1 Tax=Sorangium cellulosum TaxID=56 RepID=A0A4P2PXR3_SORCE|nr:hypothetical protein [Sorangium cellulosum]AUX21550.1 uncharacterized protein SOCEGT47_020360 [Sorangium cellulosum]